MSKIIDFPISERLLEEFAEDFKIVTGQSLEEVNHEIDNIISGNFNYDTKCTRPSLRLLRGLYLAGPATNKGTGD